MSAQQLVTEHIDLWTSAVKAKNTQGRGNSRKRELYGLKKLRELILELAVRGKLAPQSNTDEPAIELLKRIATEKAQLIKAKKIKAKKPPPEITEQGKLFDLPSGWEWTQLGQITEVAPRNDLEDDLEVGFVPMPLVTTSYKGDHCQEVKTWGEIKRGYTHFQNGDIGLAKITPCFENSKAAVFKDLQNGFGAGTTELHIARPIPDTIDPLFVLLYLKAPIFLEKGKPKMTGSAGQKRLPGNFFSGNPLPLPPLKEQHRIVAKVDELMALCDQLDQQTEASLDAHNLLVDTLLATLTNAHDAKELSDNWARLADHFDTLITTDYAVEQLKQTILQLAVQGKLVPQDPNDEPASELLLRIAAEKEQLIIDKKIKKQKPLLEISSEEMQFELPRSWAWVRFDDIVEIGSGVTKGRKLAARKTVYVPYLRVANVQRNELFLDQIKEIEIGADEIEKYQVNNGDLLITEGGDWDKVGRTAIWRGEIEYVAHQNHVFKARKIGEEQSEIWLEKYLNSKPSRDYFAGSSKQTTNLASINKTQLRNAIIAVPPIKEQHRIVAKVDELMTICDQLKAQLSDAQATQLHLSDAVVESALTE